MKVNYKHLLKVAFTAVALTFLLTLPAYAKTIWVAPGASGTGTEDAPYGTIQKAADVVEPGDTVMIKPGVYYESVELKRTGTAEKPIVFRASEYGKNKVIITGADKTIRENKSGDLWTCVDSERGIYQLPLDHKPMRVLYNGASITAVGQYEFLRDRNYGEGEDYDFATYKQISYYDADAKMLYVRLRDDEKYGKRNPNENLMAVSPPAYSSYEENGVTNSASFDSYIIDDISYNFAIVPEAEAHVVLYGLTFETPGFTGVYVRGSDAVISNCWFEGCANAVCGGARHDLDVYSSDRVTVENCEWHSWPIAVDMFELMNEDGTNVDTLRKTWQAKNQDYSINCYEVGSLVGKAGDDWIIRNNYVHDVLDGLSFFAWSKYNEKISGRSRNVTARGAQIYGNRFENLLDNGIEIESRASDLDIHHNEFINNYEPFSSQPLNGAPWSENIKFHHNYVWASPEFVEMYAQKANSRPSIFKICFNQITNWEFPWMEAEPFKTGPSRPARTLSFPDRGVDIYNNTIYCPNTYFQTLAGRIGGDRGEKSNVRYYNNIISCLVISDKYPTKNGAFFDGVKGDLVSANTGYEFDRNIYIITNDDGDINPETVAMNGSMAFDTYAEAGVASIADGKIELSADSPAIGAGRRILGEDDITTDIGAVAAGETWQTYPHAYPFGDVNCDGVVDAADIAAVAGLMGADKSSLEYNSRCDLDFNGVIDSVDTGLAMEEYLR